VGIGPCHVAIGDVNKDGKPDLVVANYLSPVTSVLLGNGDGTFAAKLDVETYYKSHRVAIGDLNGDGNPDLTVTGQFNYTVAALLGNGDGTFHGKTEYPTAAQPVPVVIGDFNGDSRPDLAVANCASHTVSVLLNIGTGPTDADPAQSVPPLIFQLLASRPNPSAGTSEICFLLPSACTVDVALFDLAGRKVRSLVSRERKAPGEHGIRWDGRDGSGAPVSNGVYLVQVRAGSEVGVRKVVVLR
jgi:hypothetical protein